jgi:hypothetical protein
VVVKVSWTNTTHFEAVNGSGDHLVIDWKPTGIIVTVLHGRNYGMDRFELSKEQAEELKKLLG